MSALETEASRVISPLVRDFAVGLDATAQSLVAIWSIKTAMVFECTNPTKHWFYTAAERERVRALLAPPDGTSIWIGRHAQSNVSFGEARRLSGALPKDRSPLSDGYVTTFALARLVIQTLTVRRRPELKVVRTTLHVAPGPWDRSLIRVWPLAAAVIRWPPELSLSEHGLTLEELSARFTPPVA
jgi:hypothetical protein